MNKRNRFTEKEIELLKEHWPTGNRAALKPVLDRHPWCSIKRKSNGMGLTRNRRGHPVNESFFSAWSPEMAYILGYTFADGNIKGLAGKQSVWWYWSVYSADKHIVEDIANAVEWGGKIYESNNSNHFGTKTMYRLVIGSNELVSDLIKLGIEPNKAKTMQHPNIPNRFISHFMRGYFDGDGSIGWTKPNGLSYISVGLGSASCDFVSWVADVIGNVLSVCPPSIHKRAKKDFWEFHFSGKNAKRWLNFMYQDATILLHRKHKIYQIADDCGRHPSTKPKFTMSFSKRWSGHS